MTGLRGRYDFKVDLTPYITDEMMKGKGPAGYYRDRGSGITGAARAETGIEKGADRDNRGGSG